MGHMRHSIELPDSIQMVLFLFGVVVCAFLGLGTIPMVFIAAVVAYLTYLASGKGAAPDAALAQSSDAAYEDPDLF